MFSPDKKHKLPEVRRKLSFLLPKTIHHAYQSLPLTTSELNLFKELPSMPRAINFEEVYEFNSSLVLIPNIRLQTSSRKMRSSVSIAPPPREPSVDTSQELSIEGVASPTYRKIYKKTEFVMPAIKPRAPTVKKVSKTVVHNESSVKEIMFWNWVSLFRSSNGFEVYPHKAHFKYFVGKGNNSSLVNQILKSRFWWSKVENIEDANLVWTQIKHKPTFESMLTFTEKLEVQPTKENKDNKLPRAVLLANQETLGFKSIISSQYYINVKKHYFIQSESTKIHNHLSNNSSICNKKEMFKNMKKFYEARDLNVFEKMPLTFHIETGPTDPQFQLFSSNFEEGSIWIIKPGESTNRGKGIKVSSSLGEIKSLISRNTENRTYIVQKYISNPLLINKRKFDIRCYALVTTFADHVQGYFFKEGYLRTSCKEFNVKNTKDKFIHLTNDAVQKDHEDYGKFESGNKLSYYDFQKILNSTNSNQDFFSQMFPQIVDIVKDSIASVKNIVNDEEKLHSFEVLGYDFMIDEDFKVWLIEINTNPCLELSSSYLSKIIPEMIDNSFRIAIDPLFPPPEGHKKFKNWAKNVNLNNKFQLVYSSLAGEM
jgi:hypothetical protein